MGRSGSGNSSANCIADVEVPTNRDCGQKAKREYYFMEAGEN